MKKNEKGFIEIEIKQLIDLKGKGSEGCLVSDKITRDGWKVGYMYREEPDIGVPDSGWRFLQGSESEEYNNDPNNIHVFALNTVCNYDPDIIQYLDLPVGTVLIRISEHEFEIDKCNKEIFTQKQER